MSMELKNIVLVLYLLVLLLASNTKAHSKKGVFNVRKFGAKVGGKVDINRPLMAAWKQACVEVVPSKVVIPKGLYMLSQVTLEGPCKAPMEVEVRGYLKAPADPSHFNNEPSWVIFQYIDNLTLSGHGTFDGQGGVAAWAQNDCSQNNNCKPLPINLRFNFITNGIVRDITSANSKQFHINLLACKNLTFTNITINAPEDSPNTDGIHMGSSSDINITDSRISTGDDCISLGGGSRQITITRVTCGPGHGISVGSLGKSKDEPVFGITVKNCTLIKTMNGVRIKTWPDSFDGIASNLHFEDIVMVDVSNPIIVDQVYCPHNKCNPKVPSRVKISDISFKNIRGSSATEIGVKLACSSGIPCEKVEIGKINLSYAGGNSTISQCSNVKPLILGKPFPFDCGIIN